MRPGGSAELTVDGIQLIQHETTTIQAADWKREAAGSGTIFLFARRGRVPSRTNAARASDKRAADSRVESTVNRPNDQLFFSTGPESQTAMLVRFNKAKRETQALLTK